MPRWSVIPTLPQKVSTPRFQCQRLIGPALSGLLIAAFGTGPSFLVNAGSFLFVVIALMNLRKSEFFPQPRSTSMANVREGIRYVRARPDLYAIMIVVFFMATFGLNFQIFNALMATKVFHRGAASFGFLGTPTLLASLSGALASARLNDSESLCMLCTEAYFSEHQSPFLRSCRLLLFMRSGYLSVVSQL